MELIAVIYNGAKHYGNRGRAIHAYVLS